MVRMAKVVHLAWVLGRCLHVQHLQRDSPGIRASLLDKRKSLPSRGQRAEQHTGVKRSCALICSMRLE